MKALVLKGVDLEEEGGVAKLQERCKKGQSGAMPLLCKTAFAESSFLVCLVALAVPSRPCRDPDCPGFQAVPDVY